MRSGAARTSRVHLIGAGGSGMSGLARLLVEAGCEVSGSDAVDSPELRALAGLGARIHVGHDPGHIEGAARVVVSPVIAADNAELKAARAAGLPVQARAQALAELLAARDLVAVAGSHGKSTSAAMLAFVLRRAGRDPGHYVGATSAALDRVSARTAPGSLFVLEACEAFGALDGWPPAHCLVTNLDDEHAEHYGGEDGLRDAFKRLVDRAPLGSAIVVSGDDPGVAALAPERPGVTTFGLDAGADIRGSVRSLDGDSSVFDVFQRGEALGQVTLPLPGLHNVRNALGVVAMALSLGATFKTVAAALADFEGVDRRWRKVGEAAGVRVFDDFAHHPAEIDAVLAVAREAVGDGGKLVVAFAPQIHGGIPRLARRFGKALSAADLVLLAPLALLSDHAGLAAGFEQLAGAIPAAGVPLVRLASLDQLAPAALDHLGHADVLVTIGPAALAEVGEQVLRGLEARGGGDLAGCSISKGRVVPPSGPSCLVSQIAVQAERRPAAPAVQCGEERLTYAELMRRAGRLADALVAEGLNTGDIVAVSLERSAWRCAAFVGVLLAGGVYLPLDPSLPPKRQRFMLRDARARFAVAPAAAAQSFEDDTLKVVDPGELPSAHGPDRQPPAWTGIEPAYVIYTSGTTGQPKGVVVEQAALANFACSAAGAFEVGETSRVSNASAFGFDVCVGEMAMTLAAGACLVIPSEAAAQAGGPLGRLVRDAGVTHLSMTPSALATLPAYDYPELACVIVAGEACPPDLAERWGAGRAFFNAYGPTEATVLATVDRHVPGQTITIGRAMDNGWAFILDQDETPVRPGSTGELWLSGAGLSRGYLRRRELTDERFRMVRPDGRKAVRAYRTGDLAAMLPDGRIRYLGRADDQVKLKGFRIELGEIEACLRSHPEVSDAVVDLRRDAAGLDLLVAYVVAADAAAPPAPDALRDHLTGRLPAHMAPSAIVSIDAVPLSPNGKRDRAALPDPPRLVIRGGGAPKPPGAGIETELHALFRRELAIEGEFGVRDTLIDLGADSLRTANLFLAVEAHFEVELPIEAAASANTIELLAIHLGRLANRSGAQPVKDLSLAASLVRKQLTYLAAWSGSRRTPESLIVTRGDGGTSAPLFWCCQGNEEHERLSAHLGTEVTVHAMRSGHLIFRYDPSTIGALAARYVEEILTLQPRGRIRLGGNCQGGIIAQEIANQLMARGREVAMLFLLDPGRFPSNPAPVSLIFGSGSEHNPYLGGCVPERVFEEAYPAGYAVDFLPGAHGLYFETPAIEALAGVIGQRLHEADRAEEAVAEPA